MSTAASRTSAGKGAGDGVGGGAGVLHVTLEKSIHGQLRHIAASVRGLGLRRRHQRVRVADTAQNRGMIRAAAHLLHVEEN